MLDESSIVISNVPKLPTVLFFMRLFLRNTQECFRGKALKACATCSKTAQKYYIYICYICRYVCVCCLVAEGREQICLGAKKKKKMHIPYQM